MAEEKQMSEAGTGSFGVEGGGCRPVFQVIDSHHDGRGLRRGVCVAGNRCRPLQFSGFPSL